MAMLNFVANDQKDNKLSFIFLEDQDYFTSRKAEIYGTEIRYNKENKEVEGINSFGVEEWFGSSKLRCFGLTSNKTKGVMDSIIKNQNTSLRDVYSVFKKAPVGNVPTMLVEEIASEETFKTSLKEAIVWEIRCLVEPFLSKYSSSFKGGVQGLVTYQDQVMLDAVILGRLLNIPSGIMYSGRLGKHCKRVGRPLGGRPDFDGQLLREPVSEVKKRAAWAKRCEKALNKFMVTKDSLEDLTNIMTARVTKPTAWIHSI